MLEFFILSFCISRFSDDACLSATRAYGQYSNMDKIVNNNIEKYNRDYKEFAYAASIISTISNKSFSTPIDGTKLIFNADLTNGSKYVILYKLGW